MAVAEGSQERLLVVLGCMPGPGEGLSGAAQRRVRTAARAYAERPMGTRVVCSGGRAWDGLVEADAFARSLEGLGVPAHVLVRERCSMTTLDNARFVSALWSRYGAALGVSPEVHVVTCEWHMPRAERHFRTCGLRITPVPAPSPPGRLPKPVHDGIHRLREHIAAYLDEVAR